MFQLQEGKTIKGLPLQRTVPLSKDSRTLCSTDASVSMEVQPVDCTNGKQAADIPNGITAIATHPNNAKLENAYKGGVAILDFGSQFGKVALCFCLDLLLNIMRYEVIMHA